jgi:GNAT superfamily N-acetyltransferase
VDFRIYRATPTDEDLVLLAEDLFDDAPTAEWTRTFLASADHHLVFALDDALPAVPIGFVSGVEMTRPDKGTEMFIYELGVDEKHRNQGVATALLKALADILNKVCELRRQPADARIPIRVGSGCWARVATFVGRCGTELRSRKGVQTVVRLGRRN